LKKIVLKIFIKIYPTRTLAEIARGAMPPPLTPLRASLPRSLNRNGPTSHITGVKKKKKKIHSNII